MTNLIAAYGCDLIALKKLQPSLSIPVEEDFQPFKNMANTTKLVVGGDNDAKPSNDISPRQQDDYDTPKFQTSYLLNLTKKK